MPPLKLQWTELQGYNSLEAQQNVITVSQDNSLD